MSRNRILLFVAVLIVPLSAPAAPAHEHGAATLEVVLDKDVLTINLESPLENLVGFEHAPRNERQRAALAEMEATLRKPERLFGPSTEARCAPAAAAVEHPFGADAGSGAKREAAASGAHAEARASWRFTCAQPSALVRIEVRLFDAFRGIRRLKVQSVTPRGQRGATLTPQRRSIAL